MMKIFVKILIVTLLLADAVAKLLLHRYRLPIILDVEKGFKRALGTVLETISQPSCSLILFTEGVTLYSTILKAVSSERSSPQGVTVMEVAADGQDANVTLESLSHLVGLARQVRLGSWCVTVVVVSHDPAFLATFAESSLKGRLLVWATRLLVVTSLTLPQLFELLPSQWTFSMMNTIFLNLEETESYKRVSVYTHLPYSQAGRKIVRVASWSLERGLRLLTELQLSPEKYDDFKGATVPGTALPFPPYWVEEEHQAANDTSVRRYTGSDGELVHAVAQALNFTFHVLPVKNWLQVVRKVEERESFMSLVYYTMLPQRLERYDMTYPHEFAFQAFGMRKPGLKPRWQSLYYPLANQVWMTILALLLLVPAVLFMVIRLSERRDGGSMTGAGLVVQYMTGMLLGQNLPRRLPSTNSSRLLLAFWLVFAFIIGTVYRGNLTAHLTLPKYPPRPETVEQLVEAVDKITGGSYQALFKTFYSKSDNKVFQKFSNLYVIGPSVLDGLQQALEHNQAMVGGRRHMQFVIAEYFTRPDSSTDLYVGGEYIIPGMAAFPIPHDAPYRPQLDRYIRAVIEAGLYEKWSSDEMVKARLKSSKRQREYLAQEQQLQERESDSIKALTLTHMQGPLMLLLLGLSLTGFCFTIEYICPF